MPLPQLIAALLIAVSLGHALACIVLAFRRARRETVGGWRYAGRLCAHYAGRHLTTAISMSLWAALLGWGGFWG